MGVQAGPVRFRQSRSLKSSVSGLKSWHREWSFFLILESEKLPSNFMPGHFGLSWERSISIRTQWNWVEPGGPDAYQCFALFGPKTMLRTWEIIVADFYFFEIKVDKQSLPPPKKNFGLEHKILVCVLYLLSIHESNIWFLCFPYFELKNGLRNRVRFAFLICFFASGKLWLRWN